MLELIIVIDRPWGSLVTDNNGKTLRVTTSAVQNEKNSRDIWALDSFLSSTEKQRAYLKKMRVDQEMTSHYSPKIQVDAIVFLTF